MTVSNFLKAKGITDEVACKKINNICCHEAIAQKVEFDYPDSFTAMFETTYNTLMELRENRERLHIAKLAVPAIAEPIEEVKEKKARKRTPIKKK